jgi:hypothetical protein
MENTDSQKDVYIKEGKRQRERGGRVGVRDRDKRRERIGPRNPEMER